MRNEIKLKIRAHFGKNKVSKYFGEPLFMKIMMEWKKSHVEFNKNFDFTFEVKKKFCNTLNYIDIYISQLFSISDFLFFEWKFFFVWDRNVLVDGCGRNNEKKILLFLPQKQIQIESIKFHSLNRNINSMCSLLICTK